MSLFSAVFITGCTLASGALLLALFKEGESEEVLRVPGLGGFRGALVKVDDHVVHVFRGIPFGLDMSGERRFSRPLPVAEEDGILFEAREPKPGCVQMASREGQQEVEQKQGTSEDCLHLNVWTPCTAISEPGCRRTVLVFLASREFQTGGNNAYDGRWLAGLGQIVVVAPNFRLGAFGFLNAGKLLSARVLV
ncbi:acetylcholinesterase-1-like [Amblyomma americanum]